MKNWVFYHRPRTGGAYLIRQLINAGTTVYVGFLSGLGRNITHAEMLEYAAKHSAEAGHLIVETECSSAVTLTVEEAKDLKSRGWGIIVTTRHDVPWKHSLYRTFCIDPVTLQRNGWWRGIPEIVAMADAVGRCGPGGAKEILAKMGLSTDVEEEVLNAAPKRRMRTRRYTN